MNWLQDTFLQPTMVQAVAIISIVSAIGIYLGRLKIFGISLGITFVFFTGILAGHLGIEVNKDMLCFAQNFGLIIFVYTLGLQVGPGFSLHLKRRNTFKLHRSFGCLFGVTVCFDPPLDNRCFPS